LRAIKGLFFCNTLARGWKTLAFFYGAFMFEKKYRLFLLFQSVSIFCCFLCCSVFAEESYRSSSGGSFTLFYANSSVSIDTLHTDNVAYHQYSIPGYISDSQPGMPDLPAKTLYFAAPDGLRPHLDFTFTPSYSTGMRIIPVAMLENDASGFSREIYTENPESYSLSGFYPAEHATIGAPVKRDGITVWKLKISPVLFNAYNKKTALAKDIKISVSFGGGNSPWHLPTGKKLPDYIMNKDAFEINRAARTSKMSSDPFGNGEWYRIEISDTGMYRISGNDLTNAGFSLSSVPVDEIRMYYGGGWLLDEDDYNIDDSAFREIAIKIDDVSGNGIFNSADGIIFYGEALSRYYSSKRNEAVFYQNHLYGEKNVYWVTRSTQGSPKRISSSGESPSENVSAYTSYSSRTHIENELHIELENGGSEWYWQAIMSKDFIVPFSAPGFIPGSKSSIKVGVINQYDQYPHDLYAYLDGETPEAPYKISGLRISFVHEPEIDLKADGNRLVFARKPYPGDKERSVHLDYIDINYMRELKISDNAIDFFHTGSGSSEKFTVSGVQSSKISVFDVTDPYTPSKHNLAVFDSGIGTLTFQGTFPLRVASHFIISNLAAMKKPGAISKFSNLGIRNIDANYIIITDPEFQKAAKKLANFRDNDSSIDKLTSEIAYPADIFDVFNWGVYDPLAFRFFLRNVWESGDRHQQ